MNCKIENRRQHRNRHSRSKVGRGCEVRIGGGGNQCERGTANLEPTRHSSPTQTTAHSISMPRTDCRTPPQPRAPPPSVGSLYVAVLQYSLFDALVQSQLLYEDERKGRLVRTHTVSTALQRTRIEYVSGSFHVSCSPRRHIDYGQSLRLRLTDRRGTREPGQHRLGLALGCQVPTGRRPAAGHV